MQLFKITDSGAPAQTISYDSPNEVFAFLANDPAGDAVSMPAMGLGDEYAGMAMVLARATRATIAPGAKVLARTYNDGNNSFLLLLQPGNTIRLGGCFYYQWQGGDTLDNMPVEEAVYSQALIGRKIS